jgi:hypothetical protein
MHYKSVNSYQNNVLTIIFVEFVCLDKDNLFESLATQSASRVIEGIVSLLWRTVSIKKKVNI